MASVRQISSTAALLLIAAVAPSTAAIGAPREPLIIITSPDPDPNFVPPREPKHKSRAAKPYRPKQGSMDETMENLGRAIGQLELLGQQARQTQNSADIGADRAD
jgi:hypothetical protein